MIRFLTHLLEIKANTDFYKLSNCKKNNSKIDFI